MKFISKIFVIIVVVSLPLCAYADETITFSAQNWGPDSLKKNNYIYTHIDSFITMNNLTGWCTWLSYYTYTYTDSSIKVTDWTQLRAKPLQRFFHINSKDQLVEDEISTEWGYIKRDAPKDRDLIVKTRKLGLKYGGWDTGPVNAKVSKLPDFLYNSAKDSLVSLRKKVRNLEEDGKEWTRKSSGKKLSKEEKRLAAWSIVTGKEKSTNFTKEKKGKVR